MDKSRLSESDICDKVQPLFRHLVRSRLTEVHVGTDVTDGVTGHAAGGSVGTKVYTQVLLGTMLEAVDRMTCPPHPEQRRTKTEGVNASQHNGRASMLKSKFRHLSTRNRY